MAVREVGSFAMNGNHEANAKDGAYFGWIRKSFGQSSSCFALYNDNWVVLALDTGYNSEGIPWIGWLTENLNWGFLMPSCKLPQEAVDWLHTSVQPLISSSRGVIILSHHQYFSSFDNEYPNAARR